MDRLSFSDKIILASTSLIATLALVASIWQGIETRNHNRLSVKPILTISRNYNLSINKRASGLSDTIPTYELRIKNSGIGPAIFSSFNVFLDDKVIPVTNDKSPWVRFNNELNFSQSSWFGEGDVFTAGLNRKIIKCYRNIELLKRLKIEVDYKSIYGEEYRLTVDLIE